MLIYIELNCGQMVTKQEVEELLNTLPTNNNLHQFACEMADGNLLVMIHKREETRKQLITGRGTVSIQSAGDVEFL